MFSIEVKVRTLSYVVQVLVFQILGNDYYTFVSVTVFNPFRVDI